MKFETVINDETIQKIYSFSDIHGDMDSLLIALRDCAKVIVKKEGFGYELGKLDKDAEALCNIDISEGDGEYIDDLNYVWNPEATNVCVVIIGDILDGTRPSSYEPDGFYTAENFKPQIEIKILRFLNNLIERAVDYNSRIIKLFGNHEIMNMEGTVSKRYLFREDLTIANYYRGQNRMNVFKYGNIGYDLLMKYGNGIMVKVNNNIFIHGQLVSNWSMPIYLAINEFFNNPTVARINPLTRRNFNFSELLAILNVEKDTSGLKASPLWKRDLGNEETVNDRILNPAKKAPFCKQVKDLLRTIFPAPTDISKLRLVIGHCPQFNSSMFFKNNRTYTSVEISPDRLVEYVTPPAAEGLPNTQNNLIFGVSMECNKEAPEDTNDHYLYRVDVGASRAFNTYTGDHIVNENKCDMDMYQSLTGISDEAKKKAKADCETNPNENVYTEKILYGSRTPQVLEFSGENLGSVRIIRSRTKNTRINQPRELYEEIIKRNPNLRLDNDYYRKKYLKYKSKYLSLKKIK
jgi:hypothetical protein